MILDSDAPAPRAAALKASSRRGRGREVELFREVRSTTERLCRPLAVEDYVVQSMPDASPVKWHLAHTSWFFETFVLAAARPDHRPLQPQYAFLFNSYYNAVGSRQPRAARGLLARPTVEETHRYRAAVDHGVVELLALLDEKRWRAIEPVFTLGLHHEQQHQELILTDLKHLFSLNPLHPVYAATVREAAGAPRPALAQLPSISFAGRPEGIYDLGHAGEGFAFDNEGPAHKLFLQAFALASRVVTNGEYLEFMEDGGYEASELWLADGWDAVKAGGWEAPLYWQRQDGDWWLATLGGRRPVDRAEPVCHVSLYEADAFARWAGARLPSEAEWEVVAAGAPVAGNLLESAHLHPVPLAAGQRDGVQQLFGDVWEWTRSPYSPYPGYRPAKGALGEYNGKFMCNQFVLRGGSCATPASHLRPTYRNFFPPAARWQFTGIRLAKDL